MNRRQLRLVLGFLAVFVLLSAGPLLPDFPASAGDLLGDVELTDELGNLLLVAAGGLVLSLGIIVARRRILAQPKRPSRRPSEGTDAVVRHESRKRLAVGKDSELKRRLCKEAGRGIRVPDLARQFGLSQDAVRAALGREMNAPAARTGSSFRDRKPAMPAKPRATAVGPRRSPYQATA